MAIAVAPADLKPGDMFLRGLKDSARVIVANGGMRIGYVHVWSYASRRYQGALEDLISLRVRSRTPTRSSGICATAGAGRSPGISTPSTPARQRCRWRTATARPKLSAPEWRKPVAALINGGTRSSKEVLAYGFKEYRLGPLIGAHTEGAVLAATAFLIGDEGLLLLAVEDVLVDGRRLEGVGVEPTIAVPFRPPLRHRRRPAARPRGRDLVAELEGD